MHILPLAYYAYSHDRNCETLNDCYHCICFIAQFTVDISSTGILFDIQKNKIAHIRKQQNLYTIFVIMQTIEGIYADILYGVQVFQVQCNGHHSFIKMCRDW